MDETKQTASKLGLSIKEALENAGLTVLALHKRTGIGRETIYRIMRGQKLPTLDVLLRIATELGVSPGALIDGNIVKASGMPASKKFSDAKEVADKLADLQSRVERLERRKRSPQTP